MFGFQFWVGSAVGSLDQQPAFRERKDDMIRC